MNGYHFGHYSADLKNVNAQKSSAEWYSIQMPFEYCTQFSLVVFRPPSEFHITILIRTSEYGHLKTRQVKIHYSDPHYIQIPVQHSKMSGTIRPLGLYKKYSQIRHSQIVSNTILVNLPQA